MSREPGGSGSRVRWVVGRGSWVVGRGWWVVGRGWWRPPRPAVRHVSSHPRGEARRGEASPGQARRAGGSNANSDAPTHPACARMGSRLSARMAPSRHVRPTCLRRGWIRNAPEIDRPSPTTRILVMQHVGRQRPSSEYCGRTAQLNTTTRDTTCEGMVPGQGWGEIYHRV